MQGIYSESVNDFTRDESPMVYKPAEEIIANIGDTVNIDTIIRQSLISKHQNSMSENLREKLDKIWSDEQRKAFRDAMAEELEKTIGDYA